MRLKTSRVLFGGAVATVFECDKHELASDGLDLMEQVRRDKFHKQIEQLLKRGDETNFLNATPGNAYVVSSGASAIALGAATAKTIFYTNAAAANQFSYSELAVGFDGTTATNTPALVEIVYGTKASNSTPGTGSTTFTALQVRGWPAQTSAQASANNCTSEPTVLTPNRQWLVTPYGGLLLIQFPLGREATSVASGTAISGNQIGCRVNAPQAVNVRGYVEYEE